MTKEEFWDDLQYDPNFEPTEVIMDIMKTLIEQGVTDLYPAVYAEVDKLPQWQWDIIGDCLVMYTETNEPL